jgi:hypothetical protein
MADIAFFAAVRHRIHDVLGAGHRLFFHRKWRARIGFHKVFLQCG